MKWIIVYIHVKSNTSIITYNILDVISFLLLMGEAVSKLLVKNMHFPLHFKEAGIVKVLSVKHVVY